MDIRKYHRQSFSNSHGVSPYYSSHFSASLSIPCHSHCSLSNYALFGD